MTRFYVTWEQNLSQIPANPEERVKVWLAACEAVKADMKTFVKDWGMRAGGSGGYGVMEAADQTELTANLLKYMPGVIFETYPVLTVDQVIAAVKKAVAAAKK